MNRFRSAWQSLSVCVTSLANQVRHYQCHPRIRGWPRPLPNSWTKYPLPNIYNWQVIYPRDGKYTVLPLKIRKLGGRDPETGRVVVKTLGGGNKKYFRWIDYKMSPHEDGSPRSEKVFKVRYDPLRTSKLALVAGGDKERWITATETMRVGDVITTYSEIPRNPIRPREGDSHPVGALPIGTRVHNVEVTPGEGGSLVRGAGNYAEILRRDGNKNYLMIQVTKQEICIDQKCMVTVGRISNIYHHTVHKMCGQRMRWLGIRPRSGAWHRKDGYCGRKNKPPKPIVDYITKSLMGKPKEPEFYQLEPY